MTWIVRGPLLVVFTFLRGEMSWMIKRYSIIVFFTIETKYMVAKHPSKEIIGLHGLGKCIGFTCRIVRIECGS